jgi:hypothetical protein
MVSWSAFGSSVMKRSSALFYIGLTALCILTYNVIPQSLVRVQHIAEAVSAPSVVTVSGTAQYVFTATAVRDGGRVVCRTIQNCGTNAVFYAIGAVATTSAYHGIIAGGSSVKDGLGSVVDLSRYTGQVSLITASGSSDCALTELTQ